MNRRNFLKICLAASAAPAFISSENLMGLWIPKETPLYLTTDDLLIADKVNENVLKAHLTFLPKMNANKLDLGWYDVKENELGCYSVKDVPVINKEGMLKVKFSSDAEPKINLLRDRYLFND